MSVLNFFVAGLCFATFANDLAAGDLGAAIFGFLLFAGNLFCGIDRNRAQS